MTVTKIETSTRAHFEQSAQLLEAVLRRQWDKAATAVAAMIDTMDDLGDMVANADAKALAIIHAARVKLAIKLCSAS